MPQFEWQLCRKLNSMYRIKYINFHLVPFFVRDLLGGETYLPNNPRRHLGDLSAGSHYAIFPRGKIALFVATNNIKSDSSDYAIFLRIFHAIKI